MPDEPKGLPADQDKLHPASAGMPSQTGFILRILRLFVNREMIIYLLVGVFTTLVNLAVFTILSRIFGLDLWWLSNAPAISIAIMVAFVLNRILVFRSHGPVLFELRRFVASRVLVSVLFEYGAMFLLYNVIGLTAVIPLFRWEISISKLISQFMVVFGNYFLSKFYIFNKKSEHNGNWF